MVNIGFYCYFFLEITMEDELSPDLPLFGNREAQPRVSSSAAFHTPGAQSW